MGVVAVMVCMRDILILINILSGPGSRQATRGPAPPILSCKGIKSQTLSLTIQGPEISPPAWIGLWPDPAWDIDMRWRDGGGGEEGGRQAGQRHRQV